MGSNSDSLPGVCPDNWHVPTDEEWDIMLDSVGGFRTAGAVLRRGKYSDFNLQWGGNYQSDLNIFSFVSRNVYFWSSNEYSPSAAWMRMIGANMKYFSTAAGSAGILKRMNVLYLVVDIKWRLSPSELLRLPITIKPSSIHFISSIWCYLLNVGIIWIQYQMKR